MTGAHADGALDNTFGNGYPTDNGIFTQEGNGELFTIFNDVAAQLHFARFVDMAQNPGSGTDFTQQRQSEE